MGSAERGFAVVFILQAVIYQVSSINQPITQYVVSNIGSNAPQYGSSSSQYGSSISQYGPSISQYGSSISQYGPSISQYGSSSSQYGSSSSSAQKTLPLAVTNPSSAVSAQKDPVVAKTAEVSTGPLDSNVLNNLAIALQLLIVSNIMNMASEPEKSVSKLPVPNYELASSVLEQISKPTLYYETAKPALYSYDASVSTPNFYSYNAPVSKPAVYYETSVPNANFLGSSGFSDPILGSVGTGRPNPRSSMMLMSPYDALGTSSDALSSFPSSYSKSDFQSPYASILAADGANDLFSMSNLF